MKKLILLLISACMIAGELEDLYLQGGITAVQKKIEKNLQNPEYWNKSASGSEVRHLAQIRNPEM